MSGRLASPAASPSAGADVAAEGVAGSLSDWRRRKKLMAHLLFEIATVQPPTNSGQRIGVSIGMRLLSCQAAHAQKFADDGQIDVSLTGLKLSAIGRILEYGGE